MRAAHLVVIAGLTVVAGCSRPGERSGEVAATATVAPAAAAAPVVSNAAPDPDAAAPEAFSPASIAGMTKMKDRAWIKAAALWADPRSIPVCWEPGAESAGVEKAWVQAAITSSWDAASDVVSFKKVWGVCGPTAIGIRIRVREDGPRTLGLGSELDGVKEGMLLNFTFATWRKSCADPAKRERCIKEVAVHEFGHALGFAHEQNRWDTPGECEQAPQGSNGDVILTPWDPDSEMNYCNGKADGILSPLDASGLRRAYPKVNG